MGAAAFAVVFSIIFPAHLGAATDKGNTVATKFANICGARLRQQNDASFLAAIHVGMKKMMAGMSVPPTGAVDVDFVNAMVPHHHGAIDMAEAELVFGANPQLRRIAQEIIVEQHQEITAMSFALGEPIPASMPSPDQTPQGSGM